MKVFMTIIRDEITGEKYMEMLVFVKAGNVEEVNNYLKKGWTIKSVHGVSGNPESEYSAYAYVVLIK